MDHPLSMTTLAWWFSCIGYVSKSLFIRLRVFTVECCRNRESWPDDFYSCHVSRSPLIRLWRALLWNTAEKRREGKREVNSACSPPCQPCPWHAGLYCCGTGWPAGVDMHWRCSPDSQRHSLPGMFPAAALLAESTSKFHDSTAVTWQCWSHGHLQHEVSVMILWMVTWQDWCSSVMGLVTGQHWSHSHL